MMIRLAGLPTERKLLALSAMRSHTPPGDVSAVVEALAQFGRDTGAQVTLDSDSAADANCLLRYDFGPGKTLAFNTHMDVNNPQGQQWRFAPNEPFIEGDRLYGLGSCDAKGSLAAMLSAIESLLASARPNAGTLVLTAVMGEEAGGLGTLRLTKNGFRADAAVVGEPTELAVCTVHKGTYMRRLTFEGRAVHSARSWEGVNAIEHAAAFCTAYAQYAQTLLRTPHPILGPANASVTVISGGTRQNTIPEQCSLICDRRLLPGETSDKADAELDALLADLRARISGLRVSVETIVSTVPSETPTEADIVRDMLAAAEHAPGRRAAPSGFNGGCDMSKLVTIAHIPTVIFGPGSMEQAHAPDEFVSLPQVRCAERAYANVARRFLGKGEFL